MIMKQAVGFALLMLSLLGAAAAAEPPVPDAPDLTDRATLESFLDGVFHVGMQEHYVTGAVVSVVKDGQILFSKGYGHQDLEKNLPVDPRTTLFRIGSTTKLLTWTSVMQLVEQGKLDLDADVNTYLKDMKIPEAFGKPITLRHIMTHTAGFEEGFLGYLIEDDPDRQLPIAEALVRHMPDRVRPPGETSAYSNYATALAGLIVEQVSGEPYNDYISKHIFEPLDMRFSTVQELVPDHLRPYVGTSYKRDNGAPVVQKYEIVGGFRPAGSGAVSAVDMAHFMIAHLGDGRYGEGRILSPQTLQTMHKTAFQLDPRLPGMALGFYHANMNGLDVIGHGGDTNFCHTDLLLIPSRQVGFFTSFYTEDNRVRDMVHQAFFNRYFPDRRAEPQTVTGEEVIAAAERFAGPYQFTRRNFSTVEKLLSLFTQLSVAPLPNGNLVVGGLGPEPWQFRPIGGDLYRQIGDVPNVITFRSDAAGNPTHLFFDFLPFMPTERVPWYEASSTWYTAIAAAFAIFLGQLTRAYYRRAEIRVAPAPARRAEWLATGVSLWALITFAGIGGVVASTGVDSLIARIPTSLKVSLILPLVFVGLTAALLVMTARAWQARFWTLGRRVVFSLVTLAATVLSVFFWYWNILGWQFG